MIVGISGYGYTGSGAVCDYLKERQECDHIDVEFALAYFPHGLQDLDHHLTQRVARYYSADAGIKDFLKLIDQLDSPRSAYHRAMGDDFKKIAKEFIESVTQVSWSGWWSYDSILSNFWKKTWRFRLLHRYITRWEKRHNKKYPLPAGDRMYLSVYPDNFEAEAKKYVNRLIDGFGCDRSKIVVVNQPFEANAPENSMKYFEDARAIIVDRDPRDVYLFAKKVALGAASFIPTDNVQDYITYYRLCRLRKESAEENGTVLRLAFEDMIYDYENSIRRINAFLGLPDTELKKQYFNPDASVNNTQLFRKYPEYAEDIRLIEEELGEYLYPFEEHDRPLGDGNPFVCESD